MNTLEAILQKIGGAYDRGFTNPNPQMSDEDIMHLYRGRYNPDYTTPDALRDTELGVQQYLSKAPGGIIKLVLDGVRDNALKSRGLKYNQNIYDIPRTSSTGAIMERLLNMPAEYLVVPEKSDMSDIY